jgi:iron complex transport system ATP-binding protein
MSLRVANLSLRVAGFELLRGVDMVVPSGQVTVVVGPNGAGKSSLLKVLCGELLPSAGSVLLNDAPLASWSDHQRARQLAVLPQQLALAFPFSAQEVVGLGRIPHASGARRDAEIVAAALKRLDASYLQRRPYTAMSGGEKQRVQLARVIAQIWEPADGARTLLLDEPTSAFDLQHQQMTLALARQLAGQGVGVLMVVHDLNLAASVADQLIVMKDGTIAASGSPAEVLTERLIDEVFKVDCTITAHPRSGLPMVVV